MGFPFKSATHNYALYGAIFGLFFPVGSSVFQATLIYGSLSLETLLRAQCECPLLWVIDTAPFFLGLFASYAGMQIDKISKYRDLLESMARSRAEHMFAESPDHEEFDKGFDDLLAAEDPPHVGK